MSTSESLVEGRVIWAMAPDKNGFKKDRPLIVLTIGDEADPTIVGCCITTRDDDPRPEDYVRLPWSTDGSSSTGLKEPSWAKAMWLVEVRASDIRKFGKVLPEPLQDKVAAAIERFSASS